MGRLRKRDPWRTTPTEDAGLPPSSSGLPAIAPRCAPTAAPSPVADLKVAIIGTGDMASAHALRWATVGASVAVGSRDAARGRHIAALSGLGVTGGGVADALEGADVVLLCVPPGAPAFDVVVAHGARLGGKVVVDMGAGFVEALHPRSRPPPPHETQLTWLRDAADDGSVAWAKAFSTVSAAALRDDAKQPVELAGDARAVDALARLLDAAGWTALRCGDVADARLLESGGPHRREHAAIAAANAARARGGFGGAAASFFDEPEA